MMMMIKINLFSVLTFTIVNIKESTARENVIRLLLYG